MKIQKQLSSLYLLLLLMMGSNGIWAQKAPIKYGKIDDANLKMTTYEADPDAEAVILCDYGQSYFIYNNEKGFMIMHERHTRIKILNKKGYDWADVSIPLYDEPNSPDEEKLTNLKATTYNLEGGKVVKSKLSKSDIFEEQTSKKWKAKKFTMPNVKEGAIIEYSYTIESEYVFNYREWAFQTTIPIVWSEYRTRFHEYFMYKTLYQGYVPFTVNESGTIDEEFEGTQHSIGRTRGTTGLQTGQYSIKSKSPTNRWVIKDVPAIKAEKYISALSDYVTQVSFELERISFPNRPDSFTMTDWDQLTREMYETESFGKQLKKRAAIKPIVAEIVAKYEKPEERIMAIYDYVKSNIKWDGYSELYASQNIKTTLSSKKGNSADINLLLITMLQEAGLSSSPVILSTRSHGKVHPVYPIISKFNYVIAYVALGKGGVLLDGTNPLLPYNLLPTRCLNGKGRLLSPSFNNWIDINPHASASHTTMATLTLSEEGVLNGTVQTSYKDYASASARRAVLKDGEAQYMKEIAESAEGFEVTEVKVENTKDIMQPMKESYKVQSEEGTEGASMIYLNPILTKAFDENPFKKEVRTYPVDFNYGMNYMYILNLKIPEGYKVEELPESASVALPKKGASYLYSVQALGNTIQLTLKLGIKQRLFVPQEYESLKMFFEQYIAKESEQIVLKKIDG